MSTRPRRVRRARTDSWHEIEQYCLWPEQRVYELVRPIVLFGDSSAERARQTATPERTLRRQADTFEANGLASLFRPTLQQRQDTHRSLPPPMRQAIVDLKAEYPALSLHELARICYVRFNRRPSPNTVKQVLADGPRPNIASRRYPLYHEMSDSAARRHAIVSLHAEGWTTTSVAGYLAVSRTTVHETLARWQREGVAGLADKSHANTRPVRKVNLATKQRVRKMQENPELGAFRIQAALRREGIHLSQATCGRLLAENRHLYGLGRPKQDSKSPKEHPYKARYRHHIWSVDVRYIEQHQMPGLEGRPFYVLSILDNFSRAILASDIFQRQDLTAYLLVLYAAIQQHGAPELLVSDSGSIFKAKQAQVIYDALAIRKEQIHKQQAWENLIETQFNLQRRLADYHFTAVTSWEGAKRVHAQWMTDHNYQAHWAHRDREDGRLSPAEVLGWVHGRLWDPERVHRVFYTRRSLRRLDVYGYVRFRHWRLYGELGLARQQATLWLYGETLTLEFANTPLSQFTVSYQPDKKHFRRVSDRQVFETHYHSPQLSLWEAGAVTWHLVQRLPAYAQRRIVYDTRDTHAVGSSSGAIMQIGQVRQMPLFPFARDV